MASALGQLGWRGLIRFLPSPSPHVLLTISPTLVLREIKTEIMGWPYQFVNLTEAQKISRRTLLDNYGLVAQASAGVVLIVIQLFFLAQWLRRKQQQSGPDVPSSPSLKHSQKSGHSSIQAIGRWWRRLEWWSGDSLMVFGIDCGTNGQVLAATVWTAWLLILCLAETGNGK